MTHTSLNKDEAKKVLETALLCAATPVPQDDLAELFHESASGEWGMADLLAELAQDWQDKGLELVKVSSGWRFQSRVQMMPYLGRMQPDRTPRYSRAAMEILAVIAYRQPVTRGDIEQIRGVAVNSQIIKQLEDRGWVEVIGHRESVGRPALFATTEQFLNDLGLGSLEELPLVESVAGSDLPQGIGVEQAQVIEQLQKELALLPGADVQSSEPVDAPGIEGPVTEMDEAVLAAEESVALPVGEPVEEGAERPEDPAPSRGYGDPESA